MAANQEDDEKLREVRAVLQSLSQFGANRLPVTSETRAVSARGRLASRRSLAQTPGANPKGASGKQQSHRRQLGAFALATLAAGTLLVLSADLFFKYWPTPASSGVTTVSTSPVNATPPVAAPVPARAVSAAPANPASAWQPVTQPAVIEAAPPAPPSPAIANAKKMMDAGKVVAARGLLQQQSLASSRDAAWLLARSYDPHYLATVKSPDASGDKEKAAEWYRRWRDIGAQNGVPMDDVRLNRLIETLD